MGDTKRIQMLEDIFTQFDDAANAFCEETDGLFCDIENQHKGLLCPQNLKEKRAKIYYAAFAIEFVYTAHGIMGIVNSILSCNVYLDKAEDSIGIPLPMFADYCETDVKDPLCIPFISGKEAMGQAFECIGSVVKKMLPVISQICVDPEVLNRVRGRFDEEIRSLFKIELDKEQVPYQRQMLSDFLIHRFTYGSFLTALRGDFVKAARQLKKTKVLTGYERRMIRVWEQRDLSGPLPAICNNARAFSGNGTSKMELREAVVCFVGTLVLAPGLMAAYLGLFALSVWLQGQNSVFVAGPQHTYPNCLFAGFITAILLSWFIRFFFYKRLFPKDYEQYREMEYIQNLERLDKLMRFFGKLVVVGCTAFCLLVSNQNLNFTQEGFTDNTEFFSVAGEYYEYSEVDYVYYKPDRINGLGETINSPSYVIVLQDGREIDFLGYANPDDVSQHLIALFQEKGIPVR